MVYMGTIMRQFEDPEKGHLDFDRREAIVVAKDIAGAERLLAKSEKFERIVQMDNWVPADSRDAYQGDFYMADTVYESPVTNEKDSIIYLVQANSFTEIEETCREEAQDTFINIQSIEIIPHEVLGFKQEV